MGAIKDGRLESILTQEELAAIAADDIGGLFHHSHSRSRVYPQDVTATVTLTCAAVANTFGPWAELIPLNTIPFEYFIVGFIIEQVSAATVYHVQLGFNIINADPGVNMEMGERRVRLVTVPIARASEILKISSQDVPANGRVMGRVKSASGGADTMDISAVVYRHVDISAPPALNPAFPW